MKQLNLDLFSQVKIKREKNKAYETRTYDYYDKKESLNIICHILAYNGWSIYGYKEDRSDYMTDYFDPARWDGIAVKNGYILVMNNSYSGGAIAGNYVLRSFKIAVSEQVSKLIKINQKLYTLVDNIAASEGEKSNALSMIEKNKKKIQSLKNDYYLEEDTKNPFPADLPEVTYQKNPGRNTWHIEKDGKIISMGTGYFKFCDIDGMKYFIRPSTVYYEKLNDNSFDIIDRHDEEAWKEQYAYTLKDQDKNEGRLDDLFTFIDLLESKVKLVLGDGEQEQLVRVVKQQKEVYYTAELTSERTEYMTVASGWRKVSGFTKGNIYKIVDDSAYKLTRKMYSKNGEYISSYKPIPNKSTKPDYLFDFENKVIEGKLSYVKLVENTITYEKEEWVKPTSKKDTKPQKEKQSKQSEQSVEKDFDSILNSGEIKSALNKKEEEYRYVKIQDVDKDTFRELCLYVKSNKLGFYITGKGFYLNSLNEKNVAA